jgi:Flp pilus assembly protein TadG
MNHFVLSCIHRLQSAFRTSCQKMRRSDGNATVELALAFSFLLTPIMLGTAEVAFLVYDSIEITNAAHAGAMYGMISSTFAADSSGIQTAAQSEAADFGTNLTVTPNVYYACSASLGGTQYSTQSAAAAACPANASNHYLQFVQVNSSATITPPIQMVGLPKTWTLQGSSTMEVQE